MKYPILSILILIAAWMSISSAQLGGCPGGNCGSICSGGNCDSPICAGGSCGGGCSGGSCGTPTCSGGSCGTPTCSGGSCGTTCSGGSCGTTCTGGSCGTGGCTGGGCGTGGCTGGGCGGTGGRVSTSCSSCVSGCVNRCSSNSCFNSCVGSCGCETNQPTTNNNCCYVMHPKTCFTEETGNRRCVVKRHRECSDGCTSPVVSIQEGGERGCQYIRNYPYAYCGNYQRLNCGDCYYCNGRYNPSECSRQSTCPSACKNNMPGCVQTPGGSVCS